MPEITLQAKLAESFATYNQKTALRFYRNDIQQYDISFTDLNDDTNRVANSFLSIGVGRGDRVILCLPKSMGLVMSYLAIQKINAVAVPLNPGFKKGELSYLLQDAQAKLAIVGPKQNLLLQQIDPKLNTIEIDSAVDYRKTSLFQSNLVTPPDYNSQPADPALIIYTSGTTGHPKGAVLSQQNLNSDALNILKIWDITQTDVLCHALPLFHVHGLCFALHTALLAGAETIMLDNFAAPNVIAHLSRNDEAPICTMFMAVPSMYKSLLDAMEGHQLDFSHLRLITSGSAPLLPQDFERIKVVFGREPVEREGMSETGMNFSNPLDGKKKPGSIGLPLPNLAVRIVNPKTFKDVMAGDTGEIWLKSPSIINSYWQKREETAKAFADGWFRSGDLGYVDEEGYYFLTDRIKHIIISGGENISPKEIEATINTLESVLESSVVGIDDEKWGEKVVAAVVPMPHKTVKPDDIISHCKKHLHPWKCPKEIVLTDRLPRNTMGKILKEEVKVLFKN
jgi:malonyl-CoA/methylmalonyl-CoA synthetase